MDVTSIQALLSAVFLFLLGSPFVTSVKVEDACSPLGAAEWRRDDGDCSTAYFCLLGRLVPYKCPPGEVIGTEGNFCVPVGSAQDDCSDRQVERRRRDSADAATGCKPGSMSASKESCAKYSECTAGPAGNQYSLVELECPYPALFDTNTKECTDFKLAKCESKFVPKGPCDYDANHCRYSHCIPCSVRFPSCAGRADGQNTWTGREGSPYYVVCDEERVVYQGYCPQDTGPQVFHPLKRECVVFDDKTLVG